jgi:hypothetical protein
VHVYVSTSLINENSKSTENSRTPYFYIVVGPNKVNGNSMKESGAIFGACELLV